VFKKLYNYRHRDVDVIDIVVLTDSRIMVVTVPGIYSYEILLCEKMDLFLGYKISSTGSWPLPERVAHL